MDVADDLSCRPDFAIALYPGHPWTHQDDDPKIRDVTDLGLRPDIRVRAATPPTFLLHAEDDHVNDVACTPSACCDQLLSQSRAILGPRRLLKPLAAKTATPRPSDRPECPTAFSP